MARTAYFPKLAARARRLAALFPLTPRGLVVGTAATLALWRLGVGSTDLVVYVLSLAGIVLLVLAMLGAWATALLGSRRLRPTPTVAQIVESGLPVETGFSLPSLGLLPLVDLRWEWLAPGGVEVRRIRREGRLHEKVVAARRGQAGAIERRIVIRDVFGLARVTFVLTEPVAVTIVPGLGKLRSLELPRSISGGEATPHPTGTPDGDRMDIRRYAAGDAARDIMWKTYARTRELNVRLPERSLEPARRVVAYLVTGAGDEPAAAAARLALQSGALGRGWEFACDGSRGTLSDTGKCLEAIARSAPGGDGAPVGPPAEGLPSLLEEAARGGAHCIVFAPASRGPWTAPVEAAARRHPGRVSFVLGADGVRTAEAAASRAARLLLLPEPARGVSRGELAALLRDLDGSLRGGAGVTLVDRESGRCYPRALFGEPAR